MAASDFWFNATIKFDINKPSVSGSTVLKLSTQSLNTDECHPNVLVIQQKYNDVF